MKSFLALLTILVGVLAAAYIVVVAPQARADTNTFLDAAHDAGFNEPNEELLRNGYLICSASAQEGVTDDLIGRGIRAAQRWLGQTENPERDQQFTNLAQQHLCPAVAQ